MIALFDSGSSHLHFGWWDNGSVNDAVSIPYPDSLQSLPELVTGLLGNRNPECAVACSVNSRWRELLFSAIERNIPGGLYIARNASDIKLTVMYEDPSKYGIDRALAAYAAYGFYRDSCVVIDAGTAVTVDAVSRDGAVLGGYIFPGGQILIHGLAEQTDLPSVSIDYNCNGIGTSTERCISYGLSIGISGALTRLIKSAVESASCGERIIITGGEARSLMKVLPFKMVYRRFLVLDGLGLAVNKLPKYA